MTPIQVVIDELVKSGQFPEPETKEFEDFAGCVLENQTAYPLDGSEPHIREGVREYLRCEE